MKQSLLSLRIKQPLLIPQIQLANGKSRGTFNPFPPQPIRLGSIALPLKLIIIQDLSTALALPLQPHQLPPTQLVNIAHRRNNITTQGVSIVLRRHLCLLAHLPHISQVACLSVTLTQQGNIAQSTGSTTMIAPSVAPDQTQVVPSVEVSVVVSLSSLSLSLLS